MNRAEVVHLTDGGTMTLAETEQGRYRITFDVEGAHLSIPVSALDVRCFRDATGMLVLGNLEAAA